MTILLGSDHAGFTMRRAVQAVLEAEGYTCADYGAMSEERYDYPDAADAIVASLKPGDLAVAICGSGIGISIRMNRHHGVRCALCTTELMATLARAHNHANALAFGARIVGPDQALAIVRAFLAGAEDHDPRHENRVAKLDGTV